MGTWNSYAGVQLKVEDEDKRDLKEYKIGDRVSIPDGIYLGYEGAVVIKNKHLIFFTNKVTSKWGNSIFLGEVLDLMNPITQMVKKHSEGRKDERK